MTAPDTRRRVAARRIVWAATIAVTLAVVGLLRVPTYLGVEAPYYDKRGSDYLWRVWWRARDDMIDVSPSWLLGAALLAGLVVFLIGIFAAYRLALSLPSSPPPRDI